MFSMLPGRKRWQKMRDFGCVKRRREEPINVKTPINDKTRLLGCYDHDHDHDAAAGFMEATEDDCELLSGGLREDEAPLSEYEEEAPLWKYDGARDSQRLEQWIADMDGYLTTTRLSNKEKLWFASAFLTKDARKWWSGIDQASRCHNVPFCNSWRGFKNMLRKQFMPFNFAKEAAEELEHLRQNNTKAADNRFSNVLTSRSNNLVQLRKMDAKIQDDMNKSVFLSSVKEFKLREELEQIHIKRNIEALKSQKEAEISEIQSSFQLNEMALEAQLRKKACKEHRKRPSNLLKENVVLNKFLRRTHEEKALLSAD